MDLIPENSTISFSSVISISAAVTHMMMTPQKLTSHYPIFAELLWNYLNPQFLILLKLQTDHMTGPHLSALSEPILVQLIHPPMPQTTLLI